MERKLNDLRQQADILAKRVQKALDNKSVSSIEIDIILDHLRKTYLLAEEVKELSIEATKVKSPYVAPVIEQQPEVLVTVPAIEKQEEVITPITTEEEEAPEIITPVLPDKEPEPVEVKIANEPPVDVPGIPPIVVQDMPVFESTQPEEIAFKPSPVPLEEIPVMKFPEVKVEITTARPPEPETNGAPRTSEVYEQPVVTTPYATPGIIAPSAPVQPTFSEPVNPTQSTFSHPVTPPQPVFPSQPVTSRQPEKPAGRGGDLFGSQTLSDKLRSETPSLNEKITRGRADQTLAHKMELKPISDLKTAIGINEKFQFVNDLFEGRIELYNDAINRLNNCGSVYTAEGILEGLKTSHNWKEETEALGKLKTFISRRYL